MTESPTPIDGWLACAWHLARTRATLASFRGARLQVLLEPIDGRDDVDARAVATRLAARVQRVARLVPASRCLDRAITLAQRLRARGIAARLRLGVRRVANLPRAHAWVEIAGVPINESAQAIAGFERLDAPTSSHAFD